MKNKIKGRIIGTVTAILLGIWYALSLIYYGVRRNKAKCITVTIDYYWALIDEAKRFNFDISGLEAEQEMAIETINDMFGI